MEYLLRDSEKEDGFVITKFIKGEKSVENMARQFNLNEDLRKNCRKNNVLLYMDILSFHQDDATSGKLTNKVLRRIAKKWISIRAPRSIAVVTVHRHEKSHTHIHIAYGIEYKTGLGIRLSRDSFKKAKLEIELFQKTHFPFLKRSEIDHDKSVGVKKNS